MGALTTLSSILLCSVELALRDARKKDAVLTYAKTTVPKTSRAYTPRSRSLELALEEEEELHHSSRK
jgi:hypothetical protein